MPYSMNRLGNCENIFQQIDQYKRVLCVCSAGLLRSPTTAVVLSQEPYNFNTRAAGLTKEFALIPVDHVLLSWADEIVCMDELQQNVIISKLNELGMKKNVVNLQIPDNFEYRNPKLVELIKTSYNEYWGRIG